MSDIVIGVDAGGSKTRVLISTLSGKTLADVTGPGAAMKPGDAEHCAAIIASVVELAIAEMQRPRARKGAKASAAKEVTPAADVEVEIVPVDDDEAEQDSDSAILSKKQGDIDSDTDADDDFGDDEPEDQGVEENADPHAGSTESVETEEDESPYSNGTGAIDDDAADEEPISEAFRPVMLFAGVAGTGREEEQIALQEALLRLDIAETVIVETDAEIALADAFGDSSGIVLIAGTGSIAFGKSPAGVRVRCGGWGITFGDEGSSAWIGRKALSVVAAAHDGREPETALSGAILTAAQVNTTEELIPWSIAANKETLGALAPSVIAVAMQGDLRANAIIDMAVEELMLHVRALGQRLFVDERAAFDVALAGGLLRKGSVVRKRLEKRLKTAVPGATIKADAVDGARGAVKLARQAVQGLSI